MSGTIISFSIEQAAIVGAITGIFSAGTIYGILKTELKNLAKDIDEVREDHKEHIKDFHMKGGKQ